MNWSSLITCKLAGISKGALQNIPILHFKDVLHSFVATLHYLSVFGRHHACLFLHGNSTVLTLNHCPINVTSEFNFNTYYYDGCTF